MAEEKVFTNLQKKIVPQVDDWVRKIDQRRHFTVQLVNTKSGTRRARQLEILMISFLSSTMSISIFVLLYDTLAVAGVRRSSPC